jgi:hypothetical protein
MNIRISEKAARRVFVSLLITILCLILMSLIAHNYYLLPEPLSKVFVLLDENDNGKIGLVGLAGEANVPAWFSSSALLWCSILLINIAHIKTTSDDRYATHWGVLSLIFLILSLDEAVSLHEKTTAPLQSVLDLDGLLYYAWVIPGLAFVAVFVLAYLRFFLNLTTESKWLFALSGVLYVGGAAGLEMLEGLLYNPGSHATYSVSFWIVQMQESLEMLGIAIFIYALMRYTSFLAIGGQSSERIVSQTSKE